MLILHPNIVLWIYIYIYMCVCVCVTITYGYDHFHTRPEIKTDVIKLCHFTNQLVTYLHRSHLIYHILTHNFTDLEAL